LEAGQIFGAVDGIANGAELELLGLGICRHLIRVYRGFIRAYRRFIGALRGRGVLDTLRLLRNQGPSRLRALVAEYSFDIREAVDTEPDFDAEGNVYPAPRQDVEGENWVHGLEYRPTRTDLFEQMIGASAIEPHCYSFIDYGSGKGRVLLLASRLPFRRVVGVEYSPELHRIAQRNLRSSQFVDRRSGPVESICMDAVRYSIPEEPVVLYFNNPFRRPIMESIRDNVVRSYEGNPRSIVVIYFWPVHYDVWDEVGFLKRVVSRSHEAQHRSWSALDDIPRYHYVIYKTSQQQCGTASYSGLQ
jgi:SAM-dependent methyltransferase